jgi:hypothetical protein
MKVNPRVSLLQSWLSPITGADLLDVFDLSSPPTSLKSETCVDYFFISRASASYETYVFSLHADFLIA